MKRKNKDSRSSIKLAFIFFITVILFITISLVFKVSVLIANSKYDGANRFTIKVENGRQLMVISFASGPQSISRLEIQDFPQDLNINKFLAIPTDASIVTSLDIKEEEVSDLMQRFFLNYGSLKTDLTIIDILKLYLLARTIPKHYILERSISASFSSIKADKIAALLFKDELIERENAVIEVVNTTDVVGLGGRLARVISNMGGNVVIVRSLDKRQKHSAISYFGKKNYTVGKLERVLGYETFQMKTKTLADVVIKIGTDSIGKDSF